jgi:hypothetical protein
VSVSTPSPEAGRSIPLRTSGYGILSCASRSACIPPPKT